MTTQRPCLYLLKREERRVRAGHPWIFSNEVDTRRSPLCEFAAGQQIDVRSHSGAAIGSAYVNPHSLICARVVSRDRDHPLDRPLLVHRLNIALAGRERLYAEPFYRLVYGEADGLPGLVVDRYGGYLVVQLTTAGMERQRAAVVEALVRVLGPRGILLRNDSPLRALEGLLQENEVIGSVPDSVDLEEGGAHFSVPLGAGQKTGWFYDQRSNRLMMHKYVRDKRVLDVFSYIGAWGIQAAVAGAAGVRCVDASAAAVDCLQQNAAASGVTDRVQTTTGDAFDVLRDLQGQGQTFDVVVVDPPAFIKRRKDIKSGEQGYLRLNRLALQLLVPGGILISCSCSMHLAEARLQSIVHQAASHSGRRLQILERGFQAPDHPVHPAIPETAYLKALFCRTPEA